MGKRNVVTKKYMSMNDKFADLCNYVLFDGEFFHLMFCHQQNTSSHSDFLLTFQSVQFSRSVMFKLFVTP